MSCLSIHNIVINNGSLEFNDDYAYTNKNFHPHFRGPGWLDYLTSHTSVSPIRHVHAPGFVYYKRVHSILSRK